MFSHAQTVFGTSYIYESGEGLVKVIMCSDILDVRKYATCPTWLASSLIPSGYGKNHPNSAELQFNTTRVGGGG